MTTDHYVLSDIKYGARRLFRSPHFAVPSLAFLGLAIGVTATVFSFLNSAILRPLPYQHARRLVAITEGNAELPARRILVSGPTLAALRHTDGAFEAVSAYREYPVVVGADDRAQTLLATEIDSTLLSTLGVRPQLGIAPTAAEFAAGAPVVLISHRYWRNQLGASRESIGTLLRIRDTAYQIVGIMPPGFGFSTWSDVWLPLDERASRASPVRAATLSVVARLRQGMSREQARAELALIEARLRNDDPAYFRSIRLLMRDDVVFRLSRAWTPVLLLFLGGVVSVLLVASVNVGTLFSLRAIERRADIATRTAFGATPVHLVSYSLAECSLLVLASTLLGLFVSLGLIPVLANVAVLERMPSWFQLGLDGRVFLFVAGVAGLVVLIIGLQPLRMSLRCDIAQVLRGFSGGGATSRDASRSGARGITVQVALSTILATASTLLLLTYVSVTRVESGYADDKIVSVSVVLDQQGSDVESRWQRMHELSSSIAKLPVVDAATVRSVLVRFRSMGADSTLKDIDIFRGADRVALAGLTWLQAPRLVIEPNFFATLQIPILRGRAFVASDSANATRVVILSARAADLLWPSGNAIGSSLRVGSNGPALTVVGVVGDTYQSGFGKDGIGVWPVPTVYLPSGQAVGMNPVVQARVGGDPDAASGSNSREVPRVVGPKPYFVRTPAMDRDTLLILLRTSGMVFGTSALIACLLAAMGVYAVIRFRVAQETREIGIRLALGASRAQIRWSIARDSWFRGGLGLFAGLISSLLLAHVLRSVIWGVSPFSPMVYASVTGVLALLVGIAGHRASTRAASMNPATALRA